MRGAGEDGGEWMGFRTGATLPASVYTGPLGREMLQLIKVYRGQLQSGKECPDDDVDVGRGSRGRRGIRMAEKKNDGERQDGNEGGGGANNGKLNLHVHFLIWQNCRSARSIFFCFCQAGRD